MAKVLRFTHINIRYIRVMQGTKSNIKQWKTVTLIVKVYYSNIDLCIKI